MFGDPGRKIKVVAFVLFAVSVVVSVVSVEEEESVV